MQTLYTKLTRERAPQFQQSTKIVEDNGKRLVIKEPLTEECNDHIRKMSENYTFFKNKGIENLCPLDYKDGKLFFTFLKGKSFCDELLLLAEQKNREKFVEKLLDYKKFVMNISLNCDVFYPTEEFKNVFGEINLSGKTAARKLNIDLIFENIINTEETYQVIDYEWIFDFLIPYEFVFYRAIHSFFTKYSGRLDGFIDKDTIYDVFGMRAEDRKVYKEMDENFLSYVYGKKLNYDLMIHNYKKKNYRIKDLIHSIIMNSEQYFDTGDGFNEKQCILNTYKVKKDEFLDIVIDIPNNTKKIRFDPSASPIAIIVKSKYLMVNGKMEPIVKFTTNANMEIGRMMLFLNNDPQIIFDEIKEGQSIHIQLKVIMNDPKEIQDFVDDMAVFDNQNCIEQEHIERRFREELDNEKTKSLHFEEMYKKTEEQKNKIEKMNILYLEMINSLKKEINKGK